MVDIDCDEEVCGFNVERLKQDFSGEMRTVGELRKIVKLKDTRRTKCALWVLVELA